MIKIHTLPLGAYQTNTYIVYDDAGSTCCVIDPGYFPRVILEEISRLGLAVDAILLTHGHFDHVGAVKEIVKATGCKLWMREADWSRPRDPINAYFYPIANCNFTDVQFCEEGQEIQAGGLNFRVLETPGHTWGSVCYLCGDALFSGDTLFEEGCGRTDLPGGDWAQILQSLRRLKELPDETKIFSGHGPSSTIGDEKQWNPYMR